MSGYIIRRLAQLAVVLAIASFGVFLLLRLIPGDPAAVLAGPDADRATVARIHAQLGLNHPVPEQYAIWLGHALTGDLGRSYFSGRPVSDLIGQAAPITIQLASAGLVIALAIGIPLGILAGTRPHSVADASLTIFTAGVLGIPDFLIGILYLLLFALALGWLPAGGRISFADDPVAALQATILPALTLGLPLAAVYARFLRTALREVLSQDYIRAARAKGLQERLVVTRHALRNALLPFLVVAGVSTGRLAGGAVIVETVFSWPGMGRLAVQAVASRDYLLFQGLVLLFILIVVAANLLTDVISWTLDPRIRHG